MTNIQNNPIIFPRIKYRLILNQPKIVKFNGLFLWFSKDSAVI